MRKTLRKVASFTIRWGIAVAGIWWVVSQMSIADRTLIPDNHLHPKLMTVVRETSPGHYLLEDPKTRQTQEFRADELLSRPDRKQVKIDEDGVLRDVSLLAMDLSPDEKHPVVQKLLVADAPDADGRWVTPDKVVAPGQGDRGFVLGVPHPAIEIGIGRMIRHARLWLLVLSVVIFPLTIVLTSIRWRRLLDALSIPMSLWQANVLNMVGLFYNTCVPMGSSGGDLLKAYYASKHTPYKTRAVLSVVVDRAIGLVVLIIVGSSIAGTYWIMAENRSEAAVGTCGWVAVMGIAILAGTMLGLLMINLPWVRGILRSERVLSRLPMREQVENAFDVMSIYRKRPGLILWAMVITVPVHLNVVLSALIAGKAFGLPIASGYYFVIVPVTVLAGSLPVSPQGIGVMEGTAYLLMSAMSWRLVTGQDVIALTMSIRLVQMFWNMLGGVFVVSGHYRAPSHDSDAEEPAATVSGA